MVDTTCRVFASVIVGPLKSRFPLMAGHRGHATGQGTIEERGEGTSALRIKAARHSAMTWLASEANSSKGMASANL